jgi:hypothetical protein
VCEEIPDDTSGSRRAQMRTMLVVHHYRDDDAHDVMMMMTDHMPEKRNEENLRTPDRHVSADFHHTQLFFHPFDL